MRCSDCHSYIPEGLPSPILCPQCGNAANSPKPSLAKEITAQAGSEPVLESPWASNPEPNPAAYTSDMVETLPALPSEQAFAPYFTIRTRLSFGLANAPATPTDGSLSFGPEGFSIVWNQGRRWERLLYRELGMPTLDKDSVLITVREVDSRLVLYPNSSLPAWLKGGLKNRASTFIELFGQVKKGLTPTEISMFQRRLQ